MGFNMNNYKRLWRVEPCPKHVGRGSNSGSILTRARPCCYTWVRSRPPVVASVSLDMVSGSDIKISVEAPT